MHWENHLDFYLIFFLHIFKYYGKFKIYVGKVINLSKYFSENFVWICNRLKNMLLASLKLGIFTSLWKKIEMVFLGWNSVKMEFGVYILIWIWKIDFLSYLNNYINNPFNEGNKSIKQGHFYTKRCQTSRLLFRFLSLFTG